MDFGLLSIVSAVIWLVVGGAFLVIPRQWVAPFEVNLGREGAFIGRLLGAAFLSLAVLDFLGRDTGDDVAQRAIAFANVVANGLTGALHVADLLGDGVLNAHAWGLVALTTALTVGWLLIGLG